MDPSQRLNTEEFRGTMLRLLMLEKGDSKVTSALLQRAALYTTMFSELQDQVVRPTLPPATAAWIAVPLLATSEMDRVVYHPVSDLSPQTAACYSIPPEPRLLTHDWIDARNAVLASDKETDESARQALWSLDVRFINKDSNVLKPLQDLHALRLCGDVISLVRLLKDEPVVPDPERRFLIVSRPSWERGITKHAIDDIVKAVRSRGNGQPRHARAPDSPYWATKSSMPSLSDTLRWTAPKVTNMRSAILSLGYGVVRERDNAMDADVRAIIHKNVGLPATSVATNARPRRSRIQKRSQNGGGSTESQNYWIDTALTMASMSDSKTKKMIATTRSKTVLSVLPKPTTSRHGLEGCIRGRVDIRENNGDGDEVYNTVGELLPASSMLGLATIVLATLDKTGLLTTSYVRAPDWESFSQLATNSIIADDSDTNTKMRNDQEFKRMLQQWKASMESKKRSGEVHETGKQAVVETLEDEDVTNQLVLSFSDMERYRLQESPSGSGDNKETIGPDQDVSDLLQELLGPLALSPSDSQIIETAVDKLFGTPPGGASQRRLNDVIQEIRDKRDYWVEKFKNPYIEARLIQRAIDDAADSILFEKIQAIHGCLQMTPAWQNAPGGARMAGSSFRNAVAALVRHRAINPSVVPEDSIMIRRAAAYAKRAAADTVIANSLSGIKTLSFPGNNNMHNKEKDPVITTERPKPSTRRGRKILTLNTPHASTSRQSLFPPVSHVDLRIGTERDIGPVIHVTGKIIPLDLETPKPTPIPLRKETFVPIALSSINPLALSDTDMKFAKSIATDASPETTEIVRHFVSSEAIPFLTRMTSPMYHAKDHVIEIELRRGGRDILAHIIAFAGTLMGKGGRDGPSFLTASVGFISKHPRLSRWVILHFLQRLKSRIQFNRTDASAVQEEAEKILKLR